MMSISYEVFIIILLLHCWSITLLSILLDIQINSSSLTPSKCWGIYLIGDRSFIGKEHIIMKREGDSQLNRLYALEFISWAVANSLLLSLSNAFFLVVPHWLFLFILRIFLVIVQEENFELKISLWTFFLRARVFENFLREFELVWVGQWLTFYMLSNKPLFHCF